MKKVFQNKWFILVCLWSVFLALTATRAMAAGTDVQLEKILKAGVDGLAVLSKDFFAFLIDVLKQIW